MKQRGLEQRGVKKREVQLRKALISGGKELFSPFFFPQLFSQSTFLPFSHFPLSRGRRGSPKSCFLADIRVYSMKVKPMGKAALEHEAGGFPITQPRTEGPRTHVGIGKAQ